MTVKTQIAAVLVAFGLVARVAYPVPSQALGATTSTLPILQVVPAESLATATAPAIAAPPTPEDLRKRLASVPSCYSQWTVTVSAQPSGWPTTIYRAWYERPAKANVRRTANDGGRLSESWSICDGNTLLMGQPNDPRPWQQTDLRKLAAGGVDLDQICNAAMPWFPLNLLTAERLTTDTLTYGGEQSDSGRTCYLYLFEDNTMPGKSRLLIDRTTLLPVRLTAPVRITSGQKDSTTGTLTVEYEVSLDKPLPTDAFLLPMAHAGQDIVDSTDRIQAEVAKRNHPTAAPPATAGNDPKTPSRPKN